ncbi:MAG: hypothetical protein AAGA47_09240 [Pseudomonadota bacterium]
MRIFEKQDAFAPDGDLGSETGNPIVGYIGMCGTGHSHRFASGKGPYDLAEDGRFREWLISGAFDLLVFPDWVADFWAYRELVSCILAHLPEAEVIVRDTALETELSALWPKQVSTVPRMKKEFFVSVCEGARTYEAPPASVDLDELRTVWDKRQSPEDTWRIEARLRHLRASAARPIQRPSVRRPVPTGHHDAAELFGQGAAAANAVIPEARPGWQAGLHLGRGYVLGPGEGGSEYALTHVTSAEVDDRLADRGMPLDVVVDPRFGKVLKHETAHALFLSDEGRVCVAMSGLRMLGTGARHMYFAADRGLTLPPSACFVFNESWKFVGMGVAAAPTPDGNNPAIAVLRTGAIWSDLVHQADLGSSFAAGALMQLEKMRRESNQSTANKRIPNSRLASPARVGGDR